MIVSRHKLLQLLGIDKDAFDRLKRAGAPFRPDKKVCVPDFAQFMIADAVKRARGSLDPEFGFNYEVAKGKDKAIRAELREMELKQRQGRMVDGEDARAVVRGALAVARERLLAIRVDGLSPENQQLLSRILADAVDPLAPERADAIGVPNLALRH